MPKRARTKRLALCKAETILLSSSGDVIVSRCRNSVYPVAAATHHTARESTYRWNSDVLSCCEGDDLSARLQDTNICSPNCNWGETTTSTTAVPPKEGLLGGAPPVAELSPSPVLHERFGKEAYRSDPMDRSIDASIIPIKSFDYTHFENGGNDMIPERHSMHPHSSTANHTTPSEAPQFIHGIPTFHTAFSHARISQVSSHPLGSHVLLISEVGLLYSYGQNHYGQLGIGIKSSPSSADKGYVMEPTIVTPLVEGGGKAIACAAGVDYSLVVVSTQQERLPVSTLPARTDADSVTSQDDSTSSFGSNDSYHRHQVYAFGRNDNRKLGLVDTNKCDLALLPRRVALSAKVRDSEQHTYGIVSIEASVNHSAALVRDRAGNVELYTWGDSSKGALGFTPAGKKYVAKPTWVESLSSVKLHEDESEQLSCVSLGSHVSFVMTSLGRCFVFGTSKSGMLGLGPETSSVKEPTELPTLTNISSISVGAEHVVAATSDGGIVGWGKASFLPSVDTSVIDKDGLIWKPENITTSADTKENTIHALQCCAGFDSTVIVDNSGLVYSTGKASGRLGLGEQDSKLQTPTPLFGGLRLWHTREQKEAPPIPKMIPMKKGITMG